MPLSFSQLLSLAVEIQDEVIPSANTAERVGGFLVQLAKSAVMPYDPSAEYTSGQYTFFSDNVFRALEAIDVGESPALVPEKWRRLTGRGGLQDVTDQNKRTSNYLIADTYTSDEFPDNGSVLSGGGVAVINPRTRDSSPLEQVEKLSLADFAALLKPYLNSTTPSTGPTVLNPIPNQTITAAGIFQFAANTFSGSGLTYTATKVDGSALPFSLNGNIRTFNFDNSLINGSYQVKVTATDTAGQSIDTTFTITIAYTTVLPYIISILRKFDPLTQTLYYLVEHSYTGDDTSLIPAVRAKRAEETIWRNAGNAFLPAQDTFGYAPEIIAKYKRFWYGNLTIGGNPVTNTVVQFKPYATAPDSQIIQLTFTHDSVQDYGTEVYRHQASKLTESYVGRIPDSGLLCCYANGSGTIKTNLVATGSTPTYPTGMQVMLTEGDGYDFEGLFEGKKPYGSLYRSVVNGSYNLSFIDEDGNSVTYPIVVTDSGPVAVLKGGTVDPGTDPDPGSTDSGSTVVDTSNRSLFIPAIQWSGGKARVVHTNKPAGTGIYLISGQNEITNLPTTYDYEPGDEVEITFVAGTTSSAEFWTWGFSKAQVVIRFGEAPGIAP